MSKEEDYKRRYTFRVWGILRERWVFYTPRDMMGNNYYDVDVDFDSASIGMWSGCVDSNGVRIFEGDILEVMDIESDHKHSCAVYFEEGIFKAKSIDPRYYNGATNFSTAFYLYQLLQQTNKVEVIENMYENTLKLKQTLADAVKPLEELPEGMQKAVKYLQDRGILGD